MTRSLFRSLYFQVLVAITAGVLHGVFAPATATTMRPLGDGFIKLALILGIDRFMSEARGLTNVISNRVATLVVARWTGDLDSEAMIASCAPAPQRMRKQLRRSTP